MAAIISTSEFPHVSIDSSKEMKLHESAGFLTHDRNYFFADHTTGIFYMH